MNWTWFSWEQETTGVKKQSEAPRGGQPQSWHCSGQSSWLSVNDWDTPEICNHAAFPRSTPFHGRFPRWNLWEYGRDARLGNCSHVQGSLIRASDSPLLFIAQSLYVCLTPDSFTPCPHWEVPGERIFFSCIKMNMLLIISLSFRFTETCWSFLAIDETCWSFLAVDVVYAACSNGKRHN